MAEVPEEKRVPLTEGGRDLHRGHREEWRALRAFAQAPAAGHRHRPGAVARVLGGGGDAPRLSREQRTPQHPHCCVALWAKRWRETGQTGLGEPRLLLGLLGLAGTCPPLLLSQRLCWRLPDPAGGAPPLETRTEPGREACPREATHQRPCLRESAADSGLRPRCASPSLKHSSCAPPRPPEMVPRAAAPRAVRGWPWPPQAAVWPGAGDFTCSASAACTVMQVIPVPASQGAERTR